MNSKKLLVFSDTHGSLRSVKAILNWANDHIPPSGSICAAAFLGDGLSDLQPAADATGFYTDWKMVGGNNDFGYSMPETATFDFADHRFFICHGHRYSLHGGCHGLIHAARSAGANAVLFGHTHVPFCKTIENVYLLNPGSVGMSRSRIGETFAVIECSPGEPLKAEFWGIGAREEIKKIKMP